MKEKASVTLRRSASGEVTGEIRNEKGEIVSSRNFGVMSEDEYRRLLKLMEKEERKRQEQVHYEEERMSRLTSIGVNKPNETAR